MIPELLERLDAAREDFLDALATVDAELVMVPGVIEDWSVRDIVVHVAAWCDHGADALELARTGRGAEFAYGTGDTDAMNERILAEARTIAPADALEREERSFGRLRSAVASLDPELVGLTLGNGDTVQEVVRYDGPDHYAEHTAHVRAWFGAADPDDDPEDAVERDAPSAPGAGAP